MNILTISGSQRKDSFNTALLNSLTGIAPEGATLTLLDYSALPLYNQDLEESFPAEVTAVKKMIRAADGIIISTPEYNRSIPAPLKNLLDWTSRPYGDGAWVGKPVYVIGASPAPTGTAQAQGDVRKVLLFLNAKVMGQPETYVSSAHEKVSGEGFIDDSTKEHLKKALEAFAAFVKG